MGGAVDVFRRGDDAIFLALRHFGDMRNMFKPIIDDLEENQVMANKVMVFCRRKEHVKELFELFTQPLITQEHITGQMEMRPWMIDQDYLPCTIKKHIVM